MDSALTRNLRIRSLVSSSDYIPARNIREAVLDSQSVNELWSNTAAGFGWSAPFPVRDRPSASLFRPDLDSISETDPGGAPQPALTVLLVEDNSTDLFVIKEVLAQCKPNARLQIARD